MEGTSIVTGMKKEYVEDAKLIDERVFIELQCIFSDVFQLQRLLSLSNIVNWDGWNQMKVLMMSS